MDFYRKLGPQLHWECDPGRVAGDQAAAVITLRNDGKQTTVEHNHGDPCAPEVLFIFELAIDEVAGSRRWVEMPPR
jgi:hypothetical protein